MTRIDVRPNPESGEVMFIRHAGPIRQAYWKPWWRAHLHVLRLIFSGNDVRYEDLGR